MRVRGRSDRPPNPLWARISFLFLECFVGFIKAVANNPTFKLLYAVTDFSIYLVGKIPFLFQCFRARSAKRVWRDCIYGPRPRNRLDVYFPDPANVADGSTYGRALLLFVHGGAWYWGDKLYFAMLQTTSFPDCTVIAINYTLHPHANCDLMVQDISLAIQWTVQNLVNQDVRWWVAGKTPAPLVVVGHSAGAHLAALALLHRGNMGIHGRGCAVGAAPVHRRECDAPPWGCSLKCPHARQREAAGERAYGWSNPDVNCFVGLSGVYRISDHFQFESQRGVAAISPMCGSTKTFPPLTPAGQAPPVMGTDRQRWDDHSPTDIVRAQPPLRAQEPRGPDRQAVARVGLESLPAWFLLHGSDDATVPVTSSARLFEALRAKGVRRCWLRYVAGGDHSGMLCMDLAEPASQWQPVLASEIKSCADTVRRGAGAAQHEEEDTCAPVPLEPVTAQPEEAPGLPPCIFAASLGAVGCACVGVVVCCVEGADGEGVLGGRGLAVMCVASAVCAGVSWSREQALHTWLLQVKRQQLSR